VADETDLWPVVFTNDADKAEWLAAEEAYRSVAQEMATSILWVLTGRTFGLSRETVRPCHIPQRGGYAGPYGGAGYYYYPGVMTGLRGGPCGCGDANCCVNKSETPLVGPVDSVVGVWIDGQELDPGAYKVRNHRWLCRTDGTAWPQTQDLDADDMAEGAFTVTYMRGLPVPEPGQIACGLLALEWLRGMLGKKCQLPRGATSVARQGVTVEIDPRAFFEEGVTGIDAIDQWVMLVNPKRIQAPPRILSPDVPEPVEFS
jgi:hypothetical protein